MQSVRVGTLWRRKRSRGKRKGRKGRIVTDEQCKMKERIVRDGIKIS